jgi:hypothetical protein
MPACSQRLGQILLAENLLRWLNQIVMPALDREESACLPLALGAGFASFSAGEERQCVAAMDYRQNMPDARSIATNRPATRCLSGRDIAVIAAPVGARIRAASMGNGAGNDHRRWDHCALPVGNGKPQFTAAGQR